MTKILKWPLLAEKPATHIFQKSKVSSLVTAIILFPLGFIRSNTVPRKPIPCVIPWKNWTKDLSPKKTETEFVTQVCLQESMNLFCMRAIQMVLKIRYREFFISKSKHLFISPGGLGPLSLC